MKYLTYAINREDGMVYSRCGSEYAVPVLQFADFGSDGNFTGPIPVKLEKVQHLYGRGSLVWTKKVPVRLKNRHRKFWGMKPLPRNRVWDAKARKLADKLFPA